MLLVHHTDAVREYAYDRQSSVGKLNTALDEAIAKHWIVVDIKNDWKTIFLPDGASQERMIRPDAAEYLRHSGALPEAEGHSPAAGAAMLGVM
jgi:hypothetical protein